MPRRAKDAYWRNSPCPGLGLLADANRRMPVVVRILSRSMQADTGPSILVSTYNMYPPLAFPLLYCLTANYDALQLWP